jgi:hypothetical protein
MLKLKKKNVKPPVKVEEEKKNDEKDKEKLN